MNSHQVIITLVACGFLIVFVCAWLLMTWTLAHFCGWTVLAKSYRARYRPEGLRFSRRSLYIVPFTRYHGCLNVTLSSEGIYMIPSFFFRFAHPGLLIPWSAVGQLQQKKFLLTHCYFPIDAAGKHLQLYLPSSAGTWIEHNLPNET